MATYTLPEDYGYVMLGMVGLVFQCTLTGATTARYKYMSKEFIETKLSKENALFKEKYGYDMPKGAYPDMVSGPHASKLDYKDWLDYACRQRTHYHYVENIAGILTVSALSGLVFPKWTAANILVYILGRHFYTSGYRKGGPQGRMSGVWFNLAFLSLLFTAGITSLIFTPWGKANVASFFSA